MTNWTGRLRKLVNQHEADLQESGSQQLDVLDQASEEGRKYLDRVREKLNKLVEDFAQGRVNRAQFEELYSHYQKERRTVEALMTSRPSSDAWRLAVTEGQSINIRRRLAARVLGYAVFSSADDTPLRVYGEFASLHERWISPLLARVNQATNNLFVVNSFGTGEESNCLCAVAGEFTTLLVLFTTEPAKVQMQSIEDLHCHFEQANHRILTHYARGNQVLEPDDLVFPYAAAFE
jgi:hypothetical protein